MATTGNEAWAYIEARRRAARLGGPYSIYRHKQNTDDFIIRAGEAAPPAPGWWERITTFQPDGTESFSARNTRVDAGTGRVKPLDDSDWPRN